MKKQHEGKPMTSKTVVEGLGVVEVYGEIDMEKLVKLLLKSPLVK